MTAKATPAKTAKQSASGAEDVKPLKTPIARGDNTDISSASPTDISTLPAFVSPTWASIYLPTLYDFLACSETPWIHFTKDEDYLPHIQCILAVCYPAFDYRVKLGERLATLVKKRSFIGRQAVAMLEGFFSGPKFANNPTAIAAYAKWATRFDGPALWRLPSPRECTDPNAPDYQGPVDFFESEFIIKIFGIFLKATKGSMGEFGDPVGALAMSAAAVERAFLMYHTGAQVDRGQFSRDLSEPIVTGYLKDIRKLTPRRWNAIMQMRPPSSSGTADCNSVLAAGTPW
ncbi:hypothetical protein BV22DRAFT_1025475 [Leucogyrophana mollusca]|uniref:Uncharacterized protein n=1 Tax=Leucogyrophana mollusca TaxID=85980 RepID=A0ACB8AXM6_9AGAM|nr:hypothetical protein BV22DRAFT_1025475 [Leucogyrophana mollusca]